MRKILFFTSLILNSIYSSAQIGPFLDTFEGESTYSYNSNIKYIFPASSPSDLKGFEAITRNSYFPSFLAPNNGKVTFGDFVGEKAPILNLKQSDYTYGSFNTSTQNFQIFAKRQITFKPRKVQNPSFVIETDKSMLNTNVNIYTGNSPSDNLYLGYTVDENFGIKSSSSGWLRIGSKNGIGFWAEDFTGLKSDPILMMRNKYVRVGGGAFPISVPLQKNYSLFVKGLLAEDFAVGYVKIWPDYVFDKSYKLLSLSKKEQFIKKEHHLPNIPSSDEIAKNGYSQTDINTKLLTQIEELYLHIIANNKRLESLKNKLSKHNKIQLK